MLAEPTRNRQRLLAAATAVRVETRRLPSFPPLHALTTCRECLTIRGDRAAADCADLARLQQLASKSSGARAAAFLIAVSFVTDWARRWWRTHRMEAPGAQTRA